MTYLRRHTLDGVKYTARELFDKRECTVTMRDLTINLSKKRFSPLKSMTTPIIRDRSKAIKYFFHGLFLTRDEIAALKQCEVSYWILQQRLSCRQYDWDIDQAILKKGVPQLKKRKSLQTGLKKVYKQVLVGPLAVARGSQISIGYKPKAYDEKKSWDYIAAEKFVHALGLHDVSPRHEAISIKDSLNTSRLRNKDSYF